MKKRTKKKSHDELMTKIYGLSLEKIRGDLEKMNKEAKGKKKPARVRQYRAHLADELIKNTGLYLNNAIPNPENRHNAQLFTNIAYQVFNDLLGGDLANYKEDREIACLVEGIIKCGCSRNQSIDAVYKWLECSRTKVRTAHETQRKIDDVLFSSNVNSFVTTAWNDLDRMFKAQTKPFPKCPALAFYKKLRKLHKASDGPKIIEFIPFTAALHWGTQKTSA